MPLNRPPLSDAEIALLQAWIDQGAAGIAGERPGVPPVCDALGVSPPETAESPRGPLERLGTQSDRPLHPGSGWNESGSRLSRWRTRPPCSAGSAWIDRPAAFARGSRRLPAPIRSDDAYERVVDRLLASPHFGERWARPWLDQARYADSNGYNIDAPRSIWKYRDWVIAAFNADMPFDEFAIDQIAGDLRPAPPSRNDRHGLPSEHADQPGGRDRPRAVPGRVDRRSREHDRARSSSG